MRDIEKFLIFSMVTHTPLYDKQYKSYEFVNISHVAASQC
jgi:hypothetical protein